MKKAIYFFSLIITFFSAPCFAQAQGVIVNGSSNAGLINYLSTNNISYSTNVTHSSGIAAASHIFWLGTNSYSNSSSDLRSFVQNGGILVISGDCNISNNIAASRLMNATFGFNLGFANVNLPASAANFCTVNSTAIRNAACSDPLVECSRLEYDSLRDPKITKGIHSLSYNSAVSVTGINDLISVKYKSALSSTLSNEVNIISTVSYGSGLIVVGGDAAIFITSLNAQLFDNILNYFAGDTLDPVVITKNISISLDSNGQAILSPSQVDSGSSDNVGITSLGVSPSTFDCSNIGANLVTLTATDAASNSSSDTAIVTLIDNISPQVFANSITVQLDHTGNAIITATDIDGGSNDNCGLAALSIDRSAFNCTDAGNSFQIKLKATDSSGNSDSAYSTVTISDSNLPDSDNDGIKDPCDSDSDNDGISDDLDKYPQDSTNNGKAAILTYVWDDLNGNGIQDTNEAGVSGMQVKLYGRFFRYLGRTTTDANGEAAFFDLNRRDRVRLRYVKQGGQVFTYRNRGRNDNLDSDIGQYFGITSSIRIRNNKVITKIDAGIWSEGSVEAFVWNDLDSDGIQDANEPAVADVQVKLLNWRRRVLDQVLTDSMGVAHFDDVAAGTIRKLKFESPSGYRFTYKDRGNDYTLDSDARRYNGKTSPFILRKGAELVSNIDAGLIPVSSHHRIAAPSEEQIADEKLQELEILFYPNPMRTDFNLKVNSPVQEQAVIMIFDQMGRRVMEKTLMLQEGVNNFNFEFSSANLSRGQYILTMYPNSQERQTVKFIKE